MWKVSFSTNDFEMEKVVLNVAFLYHMLKIVLNGMIEAYFHWDVTIEGKSNLFNYASLQENRER